MRAGRGGGAAAVRRTISTGTMLTWRVLPSRSCSAVICCATCGPPTAVWTTEVPGSRRQNRRARGGTKGGGTGQRADGASRLRVSTAYKDYQPLLRGVAGWPCDPEAAAEVCMQPARERQASDQVRRAVRAWPSDNLYGVCSIQAPSLCGLCQGAREQSVSHSTPMAPGVLPGVVSMPANRAAADHSRPHTPSLPTRQAPGESLGSSEAQRRAAGPGRGAPAALSAKKSWHPWCKFG